MIMNQYTRKSLYYANIYDYILYLSKISSFTFSLSFLKNLTSKLIKQTYRDLFNGNFELRNNKEIKKIFNSMI